MTNNKTGHWIICVKSYDIDGFEIHKGSMKFHTSERPVVSSNWRSATSYEIETMSTHKGNNFNLKTV